MPRGTPDPAIEVTINNAEKAFAGTTLLIDNHDLSSPRIIEVNMLGEVVWQYRVPPELKDYTNPGFDIEPLSDGNVLFVLPRNGVYEIDRTGKTVWKYLDVKVSHDADRLSNGNTLIAYGNMDTMSDAQAKEVNRQGQVVWSWYARDHFNKPPYNSISLEGWTHTNSVTRLPNGNTLISLRNFHLIAEVDSKGSVVRTIGEGMLKHQHDPEMLASGNILMADHAEPQRAIEVESGTNRIVWEFKVPRQLVRDANRLANGNTLITGSTVIIEVTTDGEVVWRLNLKGITMAQNEAPGRGFYKAERLAYK
jgi:outer membrane protein assembly factor BamB